MSSLGVLLRRLRKDRHWTLQHLSKRSGLSTSFLSQVERGVCSISLASLEKICSALEVSLVDVLSEEQKKVPKASTTSPIIRKGEGFQVQLGDSPVTYEHLTIKLPQQEFEVIAHSIPAGHRSDVRTHAGDEFGYVLRGNFILQMEDQEYELAAGDAYQIHATDPHGYAALAESDALVLVVSTRRFIEWYEKAGQSGNSHP